jgi:hypothetical protein
MNESDISGKPDMFRTHDRVMSSLSHAMMEGFLLPAGEWDGTNGG